MFEYWQQKLIHMQQTVDFIRKKKYLNHTLRSMLVKHRYIENVTLLLKAQVSKPKNARKYFQPLKIWISGFFFPNVNFLFLVV